MMSRQDWVLLFWPILALFMLWVSMGHWVMLQIARLRTAIDDAAERGAK